MSNPTQPAYRAGNAEKHLISDEHHQAETSRFTPKRHAAD
jgi:hypothetical protein